MFLIGNDTQEIRTSIVTLKKMWVYTDIGMRKGYVISYLTNWMV